MSVTLHPWTVDETDPEALCVVVLDRAHIDFEQLATITERIDATAQTPVTIDWNSLESAETALRTPGHPMTEIAAHGVHVTGERLLSLVADPSPYDEDTVNGYCHDVSTQWVRRIRTHTKFESTAADLALALEGAANVSLMHHRLGRVAKPFEEPSTRGIRRLGSIVGDGVATEVGTLISELRGRSSDGLEVRAATVRGLVEAMLDAASESNAPGSFLG